MDMISKAEGRHAASRNKGKLIGQKSPLKLKEIWAIRIRLKLAKRTRDLALFNLAIDSKLRGCDLVGLQVRDFAQGNGVASRAIVMQRKTRRPVQILYEQNQAGCGLAYASTSFLVAKDHAYVVVENWREIGLSFARAEMRFPA